jgi:hypothetical protein
MTDSSVPRPQPACTPADNTTLSPDGRYKDTIALLADVVLQGGIAFQALAARAAPYLEALSALAARIAPYLEALSALAARIAPYMQALAAHLVDIAEQLCSHQPGPRTCVDDVLIVAAPLAISRRRAVPSCPAPGGRAPLAALRLPLIARIAGPLERGSTRLRGVLPRTWAESRAGLGTTGRPDCL